MKFHLACGSVKGMSDDEQLKELRELVERHKCQTRKAQTLVDDLKTLERILTAPDLDNRLRLVGDYVEGHGDTFPPLNVEAAVRQLNETEKRIGEVHKMVVAAGYGDLVRNPLG